VASDQVASDQEASELELKASALKAKYPGDEGTETPITMTPTATPSPESAALAKELKKRGFRFVGPTTAYSLMQAAGMVNDHAAGCCVRDRVEREQLEAARVA
jgi:DNA-3-methyladenine glycosylase I